MLGVLTGALSVAVLPRLAAASALCVGRRPPGKLEPLESRAWPWYIAGVAALASVRSRARSAFLDGPPAPWLIAPSPTRRRKRPPAGRGCTFHAWREPA